MFASLIDAVIGVIRMKACRRHQRSKKTCIPAMLFTLGSDDFSPTLTRR
jgi:membrane protein CcdC involved in cytochrome C biogenesis